MQKEIVENILQGKDKSYFVKPQCRLHRYTCICVLGCNVTRVSLCMMIKEIENPVQVKMVYK